MSAYVNTGSGIRSSTKAGAFIEGMRLLNEAEIARNAANPGLTAKNNVSITASFDNKTYAIAASLPIQNTLDATGKMVLDATDYLGSTFSVFVPGTGQAKSTDLPSLALELSQILSAAEKVITPEADQPNNIQVSYDNESGVATISANIPFVAVIGAAGEVTLTAVDYV